MRFPSICGAFAVFLLGAPAAPGETSLDSVRRAMEDGLPAVAAVKAERLLESLTAGSEDHDRATELAVEAWVRAERPEEALRLLDSIEVKASDFWHAQALVQKGEVDEAEVFLRRAVESGDTSDRTKLLMAQVQLLRGIEVEARHLLESLVSSADRNISREAVLMREQLELLHGGAEGVLERLEARSGDASRETDFLRARALLAVGRTAEAERALRAISRDRSAGERLHQASTLALAECLLKGGKVEAAQLTVVELLDRSDSADFWTESFELLRKTGPRLATDPVPAVPVAWIATGNEAQREMGMSVEEMMEFRGHAMFLLARWMETLERPQAAVGLLEALLSLAPGHPVENRAIRQVMELHLSMGADDRVLALANRWRLRYDEIGTSSLVDFVSGSILFVRGDYTGAMNRFESAASVAGSLGERRKATYNAAISAFRAGQLGLYQALLAQLEVAGAGGPEGSAGVDAGTDSGETAIDLELDRGLDLAARGDPRAEEVLRRVTQDAQRHPRVAEAWLALAELGLTKEPFDEDEVRRALLEIGDGPGVSPGARQRRDYVRIWLATVSGDSEKAIELGQGFLEAWPGSEVEAEIEMKIAELFYRRGDFANARTEFEKVARDHEDSPFAETALYFAGLSAAAVMTEEGVDQAIELWQELADRGGPMGLAARRQQALAKRRQGKEEEALAVLEKLLEEPELDIEMSRLLMCEKAEILLVLSRSGGSEAEAVEKTLRALLSQPDLPLVWKLRASFTQAAASREMGQSALALETCYDAVKAAESEAPVTPDEFDWYYKAGFLAVELLEAESQWQAAARMAEELAQAGGERSEEAGERAAKIRLAHFIWDDREEASDSAN